MCRTTLVLALLLLPSAVIRADEAEDKAAAFVEKLGGTVKRDEQKAGKPVFIVDLNSTKISDAGLKELTAFKQLQMLDLGNTNISNEGLKELAGLRRLQVLDLGGTKISDAGLKELAGLQQLQRLILDYTRATKNGVAELQKALPKCEINHNAK
jgi:internalin A